jgi:hypothetical protein
MPNNPIALIRELNQDKLQLRVKLIGHRANRKVLMFRDQKQVQEEK